MLTDEEVGRIFDMHEDAPTMSYRYEVSRVLAKAAANKLGFDGLVRVGLVDADVDAVFDRIQGCETKAFRLAAADGIERLVRIRLTAAPAG